MSLFIASLNSGSNGNCYYVGNSAEAVLIDAGISCREIEKRMKRLDLSMQKVKAVFVSHEHADHIKGLRVLSKKHRLPVYITQPTLLHSRLLLPDDMVQAFDASQPVSIGSLLVTAFSKHHDAADPYSFVVACNDVRVGVFTDLGIACNNLVHHFSRCHAAFLEANYDEVMLQTGNYPFHLKKRISGGKGHLSNKQALEVFNKYRPVFMTHLLLSHLSENNNCPKLVNELFSTHAKGVRVVVASRYEETEVYLVTRSAGVPVKKRSVQLAQLQFSFTVQQES